MGSILQNKWLRLIAFLLFTISVTGLVMIIRGKPIKIFPNSETKPSVLSYNIPELVAVNQPFKVDVQMKTLTNPVNAAGIYIRFDTTRLQILDMDTRSSFCQFYPEKKFDNYQGLISLACGAPHPGYSGDNTLMTLTFMPLAIGTTSLQTTPQSQLLVSDGKGSNALTEFPQGQIHVVARL